MNVITYLIYDGIFRAWIGNNVPSNIHKKNLFGIGSERHVYRPQEGALRVLELITRLCLVGASRALANILGASLCFKNTTM